MHILIIVGVTTVSNNRMMNLTKSVAGQRFKTSRMSTVVLDFVQSLNKLIKWAGMFHLRVKVRGRMKLSRLDMFMKKYDEVVVHLI